MDWTIKKKIRIQTAWTHPEPVLHTQYVLNKNKRECLLLHSSWSRLTEHSAAGIRLSLGISWLRRQVYKCTGVDNLSLPAHSLYNHCNNSNILLCTLYILYESRTVVKCLSRRMNKPDVSGRHVHGCVPHQRAGDDATVPERSRGWRERGGERGNGQHHPQLLPGQRDRVCGLPRTSISSVCSSISSSVRSISISYSSRSWMCSSADTQPQRRPEQQQQKTLHIHKTGD